MILHLTIAGPPLGKGRPRCSCLGGKPRLRTPDETRAYEKLVAGLGMTARARLKAQGHTWPMSTADEYTLLVRIWHQRDKRKRPDRSNVVKAVEDGLNGVAWKDDRYEVASASEAAYSPDEKPRVEVWVLPERVAVLDAVAGFMEVAA